MTWFEAEELAKYVFSLETALDDWDYDNSRLKTELVELENVQNKIHSAVFQKHDDKPFRILVDEVLLRIRYCRKEIKERLMI